MIRILQNVVSDCIRYAESEVNVSYGRMEQDDTVLFALTTTDRALMQRICHIFATSFVYFCRMHPGYDVPVLKRSSECSFPDALLINAHFKTERKVTAEIIVCQTTKRKGLRNKAQRQSKMTRRK